MPAKHVGCLKSPDCICEGSGMLPNKEQTMALVPETVPCPGPTEAQYGHIIKRVQRQERNRRERVESGRSIVSHLLEKYEDGEAFYQRHKEGGSFTAFVAGLINHIRDLESKVPYVKQGNTSVEINTHENSIVVLFRLHGDGFAVMETRHDLPCVDITVTKDATLWVSHARENIAHISNGQNQEITR